MGIDWESMGIAEHAEELRRGLESRDLKIEQLMAPTAGDEESPRRASRRKFPAAPVGALDNA